MSATKAIICLKSTYTVTTDIYVVMEFLQSPTHTSSHFGVVKGKTPFQTPSGGPMRLKQSLPRAQLVHVIVFHLQLNPDGLDDVP